MTAAGAATEGLGNLARALEPIGDGHFVTFWPVAVPFSTVGEKFLSLLRLTHLGAAKQSRSMW